MTHRVRNGRHVLLQVVSNVTRMYVMYQIKHIMKTDSSKYEITTLPMILLSADSCIFKPQHSFKPHLVNTAVCKASFHSCLLKQNTVYELLTVCVEGHGQRFLQTPVAHDAFDQHVTEQPRLEGQCARYYRRAVALVVFR